MEINESEVIVKDRVREPRLLQKDLGDGGLEVGPKSSKHPALAASWQTMRLGGILIDESVHRVGLKHIISTGSNRKAFPRDVCCSWTLVLALVLGTTKLETCIFIMYVEISAW